jgi:hypothetical protein
LHMRGAVPFVAELPLKIWSKLPTDKQMSQFV